ncbi:hypothetical protein D082_05210 [Synechocystis sp. PCC 6714]|nr:hypothetical protein D082_05210 [Synechocystis sp. PCC 6714]
MVCGQFFLSYCFSLSPGARAPEARKNKNRTPIRRCDRQTIKIFS